MNIIAVIFFLLQVAMFINHITEISKLFPAKCEFCDSLLCKMFAVPHYNSNSIATSSVVSKVLCCNWVSLSCFRVVCNHYTSLGE